ncbi:60S ribosomal protein L17 [Coelomomyces lativittatus]|nr:60S ribosomal protein L17 [Coelomomyces lativittatus]KAJ1500414.1 60S ribosomal protein L17 [Coelomomyces lativittatus]KAJ1514647.1 60S ribosomal protein L17 [Coelomomyces lativittatus]
MVKYCVKPTNTDKATKACLRNVRVSFKKTRETANTLKGMSLRKAVDYLNAVKNHQRAVPFRRFRRGVGRTAQAKEWKTTQARWPVKSAEILLGMLRNAEANAKNKKLDADKLAIRHIVVQRAVKRRRRTYRAHGRINPFQSHPCHIEMILSEKAASVPREKVTKAKVVKRPSA